MISLKRSLVSIGVGASLLTLLSAAPKPAAQNDSSQHLRVNVDLVQLSIAVTDKKGNYVDGLKPEDFEVKEDKIPQKIATFEAGSGPSQQVSDTDGKTTPG